MPRAMIRRPPMSIVRTLAIFALAFMVVCSVPRCASGQTLPEPANLSATANSSPLAPLPATATAPLSVAPNLTAVSHPPAPTMLQVLTSAQRGFCARVRVSPVGQMVANMRKPLSVATGGLVAAEKVPHADEQAQPGPEGTAAQLKAVNLQAPKRRAAVRDLQGMDVRYHPEAEAILVSALRVDPSECVRFEAAVTIATLPVCTEPIAKALRTCIDSSSSDGNPAELSMRVRNQAAVALTSCECCLPEASNDVQPRPEYPVTRLDSERLPQRLGVGGPQAVQTVSFEDAVWRQPVNEMSATPAEPIAAKVISPVADERPKNLLEVFKSARGNP